MTVKEFYVSLGSTRDWELRRKIEKAVMEKHVASWKDETTEEILQKIFDANK